jgi:hypothetical protein
MSYVLPGTGLIVVTQPDGTVNAVCGYPINIGAPTQALTAGLVSDSDSFPAPAVGLFLLPALVADSDAFPAACSREGRSAAAGTVFLSSHIHKAGTAGIGLGLNHLTLPAPVGFDTSIGSPMLHLLMVWHCCNIAGRGEGCEAYGLSFGSLACLKYLSRSERTWTTSSL